MRKISVVLFLSLVINFSLSSSSYGDTNQRISNLEKRIAVLEKEIDRLKKQEARASKYLKCVQNVEGNALTVPFKILNCIRK